MNLNYLQEKLTDIIATCHTHKQRIEDAYSIIANWGELNIDQYEALTKEQVAITDQYVYRFAKLQDLMGDKLFKLALEYVGEQTEKLSFIDILNKLEKLEAIESANTWLELRMDRNKIAHDYAKNIEQILEEFNILFRKKDVLMQQLHQILKYLDRNGYSTLK